MAFAAESTHAADVPDAAGLEQTVKMTLLK